MPQAKKTLSQEVKLLKAENARLKTQLAANEPKRSYKWRTASIVLLAGITGAILITANLMFWTARTVIETDKYHDTARAIIEEPTVQKAIADKTTEAIFERVDTEQLLEENLPPRVVFAAPTIAAQIETFTNTKAREITANDKFHDVWVDVNVKAHDRFISAIRDSKGDGTVNISDVYNKLTQRLEGTKLAFVQDIKLPSNIGSIQVVDAPWLPSARYLVINLDMLRFVTTLLFILLTILIVYIARNRRKVVLEVGIFYALLMLVTLIAVRITRAISVDQVDPKYQAAATDAYQAVLSPFVMQTTAILALAVVVSLIAWLIGPGRAATKVRSSFNSLLQGKAHTAIFGKKENSYTKWVGKYQVQLQWISVLIAFIALLLISITLANILWVLVGLIIALAVIQVSAAE